MLPDTNPIIEVSAESNGGFTNEYQLVGLGYDSFFNDYKLVRVIFHLRYQVDVYSLKTNSWKVIGSIPLRRFGFSLNDGGVALNGSIYWLVASKRGQFDRWIVGFNLKDEEFIELQLPPNEPNRCYYSVNLRVIEGCLGVYCSRWKVGDIFVVLWMMKEHVKEEWIKLQTSCCTSFDDVMVALFVSQKQSTVLDETEIAVCEGQLRRQIMFSFGGLELQLGSVLCSLTLGDNLDVSAPP
ncbi:hypothetical protein LguiA_031104 [Lonicera macranthoides]